MRIGTRNATRAFAAFAAAAALGACSTLNVNTDWNTTIDFTKYKTFDFKHDSIAMSAFGQNRMRGEIENMLNSHGITRTAANPELIVIWRVNLSSQTQYTTVSTGGYAYGPAWGGYGGYWGGYGSAGVSTTTQQKIPLGALTIAMVDTKSNALVWRGEADAQLNDGESNAQLVHDAVQQMFKQFPPKPGEMPSKDKF